MVHHIARLKVLYTFIPPYVQNKDFKPPAMELTTLILRIYI